MNRWAILSITLVCLCCCCAVAADAPIRVLIFSGRNNHDWKTTTPVLEKLYGDSDRFVVDVTEDPAACTAGSLANYDVVVDNWSAYPDMTGRQWGETAENALLEFIRGGKGFVAVHAAVATFADWPEFHRITGLLWHDDAGHTAIHPFEVSMVDTEHSIAKGLPPFMTAPDELYQTLKRHPSMKVVCSAYSNPAKGGTGQYEPVVVCTEYGKGRCVTNILGHDARAMNGTGFQTLMLRGAEWAATGNVTIPVPEDLPVTRQTALPVKALVLTGGHSFDEQAFPPLFEGHDGIEFSIVPQPKGGDAFEDISQWDSDVIVLYNFNQRISKQARKNLVALLDRGVGLVILHHAIMAYPDWPEYWDIVGTKYLREDTEIDGVTYTKATYKHDVDFTLHIEDPAHPVTGGLVDFTVHDETYANFHNAPDNHNLLTTEHPDSGPVVAWTRNYGKARVCFIELGHGPQSFSDPNYRRLVAQAVRWAAPAQTGDPLDELLASIREYEHGQSQAGLYQLAALVGKASGSPEQRETLEAKLLAVLESDATVACKKFVCKQLSFIGGENSLGTLSPMLTDAELSTMARYAIERIPGSAADQALCAALDRTTGEMQVGIINSLGNRRVADATGALGGLVRDGEPPVAVAAAAALGKIGTKDAATALAQAPSDGPAEVREAVARAKLDCADQLLREGETKAAMGVFDAVYAASEPGPVRAAAFRGLVMAKGKKGTSLVVDALAGNEADVRAVALGLVRQVPGKAATKEIAGLLEEVPDATKVLILNALADRGDPAARPEAVSALGSENPAVRVAALEALAVLGDASVALEVAERAASSEGPEQQAARKCLERLRGSDVDHTIIQALSEISPAIQVELIGSLARRQATEAVPALLERVDASDQAVRIAAFEALGTLADGAHLEDLLAKLAAVQEPAVRDAAEKATVSVARGMPQGQGAVIVAAFEQAQDPAVSCSLLRVLGAVGDSGSLPTVKSALGHASPEVRDAAVRGLADWPSPEPIPDLLALAKDAPDETHRILALRGAIRLIGTASERQPAETLDLYRQALGLAARPDEKKQALAGLAAIRAPEALAIVTPYLEDTAVSNEADRATLAIVRAIAGKNPAEAGDALRKLCQTSKSPVTLESARTALAKIQLNALAAANIAPQGKATSPDDLDRDGAAGGDAAAIDGNPETYWDEVDNQSLYRLRVTFDEPKDVAAISILGHKHHEYAPKDFRILCDGNKVKRVRNAEYVNNMLLVGFAEQHCKTVELEISGYYGASPAIRELGIYGSVPEMEE